MYFINEEHEKNQKRLQARFARSTGDKQYEANIYIASVPEIFKCFPEDLGQIEDSPLSHLVEFSEVHEKLIPSHPALTGSTREMVEFGMSLFNGHPVSLDGLLGSLGDDTFFDVLVQAMKIRANKS